MGVFFSLALAPAVILLVYIYHKDKAQPEPISKLLKGVFYGVLSCLLTLAMTSFMPDFGGGDLIGAAMDAFFNAAIPEEMAKLFMLWLLVRKMKEFDEPLDGIVYAVCVGMGFAAFENVMYLLQEDDMVAVGIMRGLFSVPGHFCFAVAMGFYYALAHFGKENKMQNKCLALFVPIMLHGIYDTCLMMSSDSDWWWLVMAGWFVFFVVMFKHAVKRINKLREMSLEQNSY